MRAFPLTGTKFRISTEGGGHPLWSPDGKELFFGVNFQVMRRTWSSMSKAAGANAKVVADQLGHSVKVDMAEYTKSTIDQKREAVRKFEDYVQ